MNQNNKNERREMEENKMIKLDLIQSRRFGKNMLRIWQR